MTAFVFGMMVGASLGFVAAGLLIVGGDGDDD